MWVVCVAWVVGGDGHHMTLSLPCSRVYSQRTEERESLYSQYSSVSQSSPALAQLLAGSNNKTWYININYNLISLDN